MRSHRAEHRRPSRSASAEMWTWPSAAGAAALVLGTALSGIRPPAESTISHIAWPGDVAAASTMLQTIAAATIATITLTFTLTVVALQLASQQFSPRLLRDFMRDRVTKAVLALLVATFVFSVTVLRGLREDAEVPSPALLVTFVLAVAALGGVLAFINHFTRALRVDTIMLAVHGETVDALQAHYPAHDDARPRSPEELQFTEKGHVVVADRSGFVRAVSVDKLVATARHADALVWLQVRPGDHVVRGSLLAHVWTHADDAEARTPWAGPAVLPEDLGAAIHDAVLLDYERSMHQDAAFGFRQLTDIAVKALSPGINDPVTAAHAVGHMADLFVRLAHKRLGPTVHEDADGLARAVVDDRDLRYYLDLVCGQIRRYGDAEPTVLIALLRMLRDLATAATDDEQRTEVERQVDLILAEVPTSLTPSDVERIEDLARRVRAALDGDISAAFVDRAGETRSL